MKKLVLCFAVVFSCLLISASTASVFQIEETSISEREIILRAQLGQTKVRSVAYYDVIGVKDATLSSISVEIRCPGQFLVTIQDDLKTYNEEHIVIRQEENSKEVNISISDLKKGRYILTVQDESSGKLVSGYFNID